LLWAAAWLHRATKNPSYLNYITVNGQTLGADESDNTFSWDNKHVGARVLLSKVIPASGPHFIPFCFIFIYYNFIIFALSSCCF
jgi:Glycosyl hydrolase family 9